MIWNLENFLRGRGPRADVPAMCVCCGRTRPADRHHHRCSSHAAENGCRRKCRERGRIRAATARNLLYSTLLYSTLLPPDTTTTTTPLPVPGPRRFRLRAHRDARGGRQPFSFAGTENTHGHGDGAARPGTAGESGQTGKPKQWAAAGRNRGRVKAPGAALAWPGPGTATHQRRPGRPLAAAAPRAGRLIIDPSGSGRSSRSGAVAYRHGGGAKEAEGTSAVQCSAAHLPDRVDNLRDEMRWDAKAKCRQPSQRCLPLCLRQPGLQQGAGCICIGGGLRSACGLQHVAPLRITGLGPSRTLGRSSFYISSPRVSERN
jgi:hypothetical protein